MLNHSLTYTAANASGTSAPTTVTVNVTTPNITVLPSAGALPAGTVGVAYAQSLSASDGASPYTYAVTSGTLPTGLGLASNGTISGSAIMAGSASFDVTATDQNGASGSTSYSITVNPPPFIGFASLRHREQPLRSGLWESHIRVRPCR